MNLPSWLAATTTALVAAVLPACDAVNLPEIKPGITTASEVRSRLGNPGIEFRNEDGSVTWEYSRQPNGVHCYMITIGGDQVVQKMEQVLTEANFAKVRPGMSRDEIRRLLGAPASKTVFDNLGEDIWEWRIEGMPVMDETYFMVHFDLASGGVKKTSKRVAAKG
jgi:outer membrane protein assembly factor BamE (lipoprotein component of BamABCDE complex)